MRRPSFTIWLLLVLGALALRALNASEVHAPDSRAALTRSADR